jgi:hypothetical protein
MRGGESLTGGGRTRCQRHRSAGRACCARARCPINVTNYFHDSKDPAATERAVEKAMRNIARRNSLAATHD